MTLTVVPEPEYRGEKGLVALRQLRKSMRRALKDQDWMAIDRLDRSCGIVVDRVLEIAMEAPMTAHQRNIYTELQALQVVYAECIRQTVLFNTQAEAEFKLSSC